MTRRILSLVGGVVALAALTGCPCIPCSTVEPMRYSLEVLGEEYRAYVEADPTLDDAQRARRLAHLAEHEALLEDMERECEK